MPIPEIPAVAAGCIGAVVSAVWAILLRGASYSTFAAAFLIAGACNGLSLLAWNQSDVNWMRAAVLAFVLMAYQSALLLAFRSGIQTMQALVNTNVLVVVLADIITGVAGVDVTVVAVCCVHAVLGYCIVILQITEK